ncbi:hypothetical protein Q8W71_11655 [Methylobacterium sp. NEAU 140]|nr:hypothetical protein [Methylobacterium sp. NEAU 140]MDP4023284.1 hypothetical protein [Methylobacterium sp. NEAU 140]
MTAPMPGSFAAALTAPAPSEDWPAPLAALWWSARGEAGWARAHALVQDAAGPEAAWVHAHLHRIEGDAENARYWYARAGRGVPDEPVAEERAVIAAALMQRP